MFKNHDDFNHFWLPLFAGIFFFALLTFTAPCCFGAEVEADNISVDFYAGLTEGLDLVGDFCGRCDISPDMIDVYFPDDLTGDILVTRDNSRYIVEELIGICEDEAGNGYILNTADDFYTYISYRGLDIYPGDIVVTFCLYDPAGHGEDDIIVRHDYVVDTDQLIEE